MDADAAREYLTDNHRGVLITQRKDGRPQSSPVVAGLDETGALTVSTRETAVKVKNLERTPKAWFCGFSDGFFGPWVQVEGSVEIVRLPEAMDGLIALYRTVAGEHPDWDDYRAAMERERRVLLRLSITDAGPDRSG